jgi:hypothetical protein
MLKPLKAKETSAQITKAVNLLIQNQNAIIAEIRRGGGKTQEEADAIAELFEEQE